MPVVRKEIISGESAVDEQPANRHHIRSIVIVGAVVLLCLGVVVYVGWAIFEMVSVAHISGPSATVKLMFLGLVFGLLGVFMQRRERRRR
jgi:hypothetical protein